MSPILIGIPCLKIGGTEIQTLRLVEALVEGGYHCVTVCYFEYDFQMVQQYEKAGSKVVCLSAYGRRPEGNRATYKFLKTGLKRVIAEYRPKIAHIQYMAPGAMPIIILHKLGIKKIIATLHTNSDIYKNLRLIHFLQKHKTVAFTCVTEQAERSFFGSSKMIDNNFKLNRHNHLTIHNCLAPNTKIGTTPVPSETPVIGVVARLEEIKGVDYIMPAFSRVLQEIENCRLMIVGDGQMREKMLQQQHELDVPIDKVIWVGRVAYEKLPEYYKQMSLVWMPSRSEGFGLSAIEAMAQGRTVIASNTGGLSEIINDGKDGLLFEVGNVDELAKKTVNILSNKESLNEMSIAASKKAETYCFERYKNNIIHLYSQLA